MMKGISPLITTVIILAVAIALGVIVTGSVTSVMKSQTETTSKTQKCPANILEIINTDCGSSTNGTGTIKMTIMNKGTADLTNFSMLAVINGVVYTNSSLLNGNQVLKTGQYLNLEAYLNTNATIAYKGQISKLVVSAGGDCPGVGMELKNDTTTIGTCY